MPYRQPHLQMTARRRFATFRAVNVRAMGWALGLIFLAALLLGCAAAPTVSPPSSTASADDLLVAAAADLQYAFTDIGARYEALTGQRVSFTFGSTGQLTSQIENGAPFDLLAAANVAYIEQLAAQGLIVPGTQQRYAQGRIVLAVNRAAGIEATALADLIDPRIMRVAIANPAHAPYGLAARQALERAGLWEEIQPKLVLGENVAQTLQYIQSGDAEAGIVALSIAGVEEVEWTLIDDALHAPINQALAVIAGSPREAASRDFAAFINGPEGRLIMERYGFILPADGAY